MKKIYLLFLLSFFGFAATAQDVFYQGTVATNVSVGLGGNVAGYGLGLPPISLAVDYGIVDNLINGENGSIGIGGYLGFATNGRNYNYFGLSYKARYTRMAFGVRGTFHYQFLDKLDTYAGLMLGLYSYSWKYDWADSYDPYYSSYYQDNTRSSEFAFSAFAGARYYFKENLGVNAEIGYGFTYLSAGLTYRINTREYSKGFHNVDGSLFGGIDINALRNNQSVILDNITFESNSSELSPSSEDGINSIVNFLNTYPEAVVIIDGHTDDTGDPEYNMTLSKMRADAVKKALVEKGVAGGRIKTEGYGATRPLYPNDSEENRALNRRVELKFDK